MTREEAIKELKRHISPYKNCKADADANEALAMAIKALEQQPCEDCISRQAVLDGVDRYIYKSQSTGTQDDFYSFAELVVKELPSVTPKEKTGHWADEEVGFDGDIAYRCSNCNELFWLEDGTPKDNEYNFCPNCGARMVEPQESEEA